MQHTAHFVKCNQSTKEKTIMYTFLCYDRCTTCKKAEKWLKEHSIPYQARPIKTEPPTEEELLFWQKKSGLPFTKFFNTSGKIYRENNLKEKIRTMSDTEMAALLATDGMLVKRPILYGSDLLLVGFRENDWNSSLL